MLLPRSALATWRKLGLGLVYLSSAVFFCQGQLVLNEILFNPPGSDLPNEYIELRGSPHELIPADTYLVVLEGDTNGNPGVVQNVFALSGRRLGGNGHLVLLQKGHSYALQPGTAFLENTSSDEGFGSGSSSSIGHEGDNDQVDLENGSASYFLLQSTNAPVPGHDLDPDNTGAIAPNVLNAWTTLDSIAVLDNDGVGDISYAGLTFRRNPGATAAGLIVDLAFTPDYFGRSSNTVGQTPEDWVASGSLEGNSPLYYLGDTTDTSPSSFADSPLNHIGGPNFGAAALPGILFLTDPQIVTVAEAGVAASFALALNTSPAGPVTLELSVDGQIELRTDQELPWQSSVTVVLTSASPITLFVAALEDIAVEPSPYITPIQIRVLASQDPAQYPLTTFIPDLPIHVLDNDRVLLNELKVNPPGPDEPFEYIEIRGVPNAPLDHVMVVAVEGDQGADPGKASRVFDLSGYPLGDNGLLVIAATNHPYLLSSQTTWVPAPSFSDPGGGLGNGTISFLLLTAPEIILEGDDLDKGDNGVLEGLPERTHLMDAVGWSDQDTNDIVFGGVELDVTDGTPDAASRFPANDSPLSPTAWLAGNLLGEEGSGLVYNVRRSTANFAPGTALTPGRANNTAPAIGVPAAFSGVLDDPTNPQLDFGVADAESTPDALVVNVQSDNPLVLPNENIQLIDHGAGQFTATFTPIGIGYANLSFETFDGDMTGVAPVLYGASAAGTPESRFHTGAADSSTAIALGPDLMLVGDDETQILRLYPRLFSGPPVTGYNVGPFLQLTDFEDGMPREVDIEGSDQVGNLIYWIGSHSHSDLGEIRTNRARIFVTELSATLPYPSVTVLGYYNYLKQDLVMWDVNNVHGKGPGYYGFALGTADGLLPKDPAGRGFNIEGFTMAPGSTNVAWVCFRAPIVPAALRLYALIVPVLNFDVLARSMAPPGAASFGEPIELDLQGRGIRSIDGDTNGFLIIAGPAGNIPTPSPPSDFKIYTWSGNPADPPRQHSADLTGLTPEVIVEPPPHPWTPESRFQIISDNGRTFYYGDLTPGKFLPHPNLKKIRSDWITLGPVVSPQPFFTSLLITNQTVHLVWRAVPGDSYRLQTAPVPAGADWTNLAGVVTATGPLAATEENLDTLTQRFYRVLRLPP